MSDVLAHNFSLDVLLDCYRQGLFPMADDQNDPDIYLVDPDFRGIIPLDGLHVSKSMRKFIKKMPFHITRNSAFSRVLEKCAEPAPDREGTWINHGIATMYRRLHNRGDAHSVEVWHGDVLVGGLYGVALGGAFFGESMFSRETNASKVALVHLVKHLNETGFVLLDTQFLTPHLASLGGVEISRQAYHELLQRALRVEAGFHSS